VVQPEEGALARRIVALERGVKELTNLLTLGLVGSDAEATLRQHSALLGALIGDVTLGNVLTGPFPGVDSSMAIRYADPVGAATPTDYKAGSINTKSAETDAVFGTGTVRAVPFYMPGKPNLVYRISAKVITAGAGGESVRLGIYANDGNVKPTHLLLDAGEIDVSTTGMKTIAIKESFPRGLLWLVATMEGNARMVTIDGGTTGVWALLGEQAGTLIAGWKADHTYGSLPEQFGVGGAFTQTTTVIAMWLSFLQGGWS